MSNTDDFRKLATISRIEKIEPIPDADKIVLASMTTNSWEVIVKKDDINVGDLCIYMEIDSMLPKEERYSFLEGRASSRKIDGTEWHRLKTVRMKNTLSQGLCLPLSMFPEIDPKKAKEGMDVTAVLGIKLYEPAPYSHNRQNVWSRKFGKGPSMFPHFIKKTDQIRVQSIRKDEFENLYKGQLAEVTVKMDGTSCSMYYNKGKFGVCSRNLEVYHSKNTWLHGILGYVKQFGKYCGLCINKVFRRGKHKQLNQWGFAPSVYRDMAVKYDVEKRLSEFCKKAGRNLAIQGEICGTSIQDNRENLKDIQFFVFDIWDIDKQTYLDANERFDIVKSLGLNHVLQLSNITVPDIESLLKFARGPGFNSSCREGIVVKLITDPNKSFKVINNDYLEKHGL